MMHLTRNAVIGLLAVTVLLACSEEQKRDIEGGAIKSEIQEATEGALSDRDIVVDGDVDCEADVADSGAVTASCSGTDVAGTDFGAVMNGTVDVDEATCTGTLTVTWGEEVLLEDSDYDCLDS